MDLERIPGAVYNTNKPKTRAIRRKGGYLTKDKRSIGAVNLTPQLNDEFPLKLQREVEFLVNL